MTSPILPGATIGIIGGGQLGRMLSLEARRMGYRCAVLDPSRESPAAQVADDRVTAPLDDVDAVLELGRRSDVVTLEWENANVEAARALEAAATLHPGSHVLEVAQHRLREKDTARRFGLPTAGYRRVDSLEALEAAVADLGTPALLKTCRGGYDGRGQARIRSVDDAPDAYTALAALEPELILERWVAFRCEISVITARSAAGEVATFPVGENVHVDGILETTRVPARIAPEVEREARRIGEAFAESLGVVGVLAIEMFVDQDDRLLVNEIAPRVHNSGHYTWEACATSQFEQHLRAICGLPLGSTELLRPAAMINLLGHEIGTGLGLPAVANALRYPALSLHLYGKHEARPGRKMGHLTALASRSDEALEAVRAAKRLLMEN